MEHHHIGSTVKIRNANSAQMPHPDADRRHRSEVEVAQDNLDTEMNILREKLARLEERLIPVLNPIPVGEGSDCCEAEIVAPIVSFIGRNTRVAQGFNSRIDDLLRNLAI